MKAAGLILALAFGAFMGGCAQERPIPTPQESGGSARKGVVRVLALAQARQLDGSYVNEPCAFCDVRWRVEISAGQAGVTLSAKEASAQTDALGRASFEYSLEPGQRAEHQVWRFYRLENNCHSGETRRESSAYGQEDLSLSLLSSCDDLRHRRLRVRALRKVAGRGEACAGCMVEWRAQLKGASEQPKPQQQTKVCDSRGEAVFSYLAHDSEAPEHQFSLHAGQCPGQALVIARHQSRNRAEIEDIELVAECTQPEPAPTRYVPMPMP